MKQAVGIPIGIDSSLFSANIFQYSYEEEIISSLIPSDKVKARDFHTAKLFIDNLCVITVDGSSFCDMYPKEFKIRLKITGDHARISDFDIAIKGTFIYERFTFFFPS